MNKITRSGILAVGLVTLIGFFSVTSVNAQIVNEVLKRMEAHYKALTSLKASVKMDQFTSQTGDRDVRDGNLIYIPQKGRDAAFRIDWTTPAESLSVVDKQYIMYRVKLKTAYSGSVNSVKGADKANGALALLNMSKADLKANYDINYVGQENVSGGVATWHLQLIPKAPAKYKNADIWVDVNGMLVQMKQTEKNNDTTTILLSNLNKNATINRADLKVRLPKGVTVTPS